eukprot:scaffold3478_cov73-Cylindrotheca_fusiformis.AAC.1
MRRAVRLDNRRSQEGDLKIEASSLIALTETSTQTTKEAKLILPFFLARMEDLYLEKRCIHNIDNLVPAF